MKRTVAIGPLGLRGSGTLARALIGLLLVTASAVRAADDPARPSDVLLRLVPPDVAVVVTVEGLRDHARAFSASQLARKLGQLPAVKAWLDSERFQQFERSRAQIEALLGSSLPEIRDDLLGDAVVLALRLPADVPADPSQASGLLLLKARDQVLLKRVVRVLNTAQEESGELARIRDIDRNGTTYHVREFPAEANRLREWYVIYPDGTFALSNSEALIHAVMDRKVQPAAAPDGTPAGTTGRGQSERGPAIESGLDNLSKLQAIKRSLPDHALARLFVDPRPIARLIAASAQPRDPAEGKMPAVLERYLAAVDYAGAALVWSERSLKLHTVETLDPSKLDPFILRWAGDARPFDPALDRLPPTALAAIAMHIDAAALLDAIQMIIPDQDQRKLTNFETILGGLLLGQDVKTRILPSLGPGAIAYLDAPDEVLEEIPNRSPKEPGPLPFPIVLVIGLQGRGGGPVPASEGRHDRGAGEATGPTVADALDNAMRTLLALLALDQNRGQGRGKIVTRSVAGVPIRTLDVPIPFAYAIDRTSRRVIVSTSADAIARYLEHAADPQSGARFRQFQAAGFASAQTFGCIDLEAINRFASRHRARLVEALAASQGRPIAEVDRDLTQVQGLARLIDAVLITTRIDSLATTVERSVGVIFPAAKGEPARNP